MKEIEQQKTNLYNEDARSSEILFDSFETRLSLSKTQSKIIIISLSSILQNTFKRFEFDVDD